MHGVRSHDKPAKILALFAAIINWWGYIGIKEISPVCTHTLFIWPFIYPI